LSRNPLFQVMMALHHTGHETLELPGVKLSGVSDGAVMETDGVERPANFDLTLSITDLGHELAGVLTYSRDLFEARTIKRLSEHYANVLEGVVKDSEMPIWSLDLLSEMERKQIVEEWNATIADYRGEKLIHELFEEKAGRGPDAVALIYEDQSLTYGELNARANRLAHHLRGLGVGPESKVAICLERSLEMVIGLLATLKAGGAYVPLDPAYPPGRLAYMLEDCAPLVLLSLGPAGEALAADFPRVLTLSLDRDAALWAGQPEDNLADYIPNHDDIGLKTRSLAYIIYTSGSTGLPKGVMIEHANLVRLLSGSVFALKTSGHYFTPTRSISRFGNYGERWPTVAV
jgi:non-ribosomal peptide synthetase component F